MFYSLANIRKTWTFFGCSSFVGGFFPFILFMGVRREWWQWCGGYAILDLNGQNDPPLLRFQEVIDNLNTLSSFIICQLLSCFPPTVSVLLRPFQGSDFLSHPHIKSLQTWKVAHTHFRYNNCSFMTTPPLNAQENKLSKKPAGQSVSHHIRTAMPSYAELHTPKQGDGPWTKAVFFSSNLSSAGPRWPPWQRDQHQLYSEPGQQGLQGNKGLCYIPTPQWRNSSELSNYITNPLTICNGMSQHTRSF